MSLTINQVSIGASIDWLARGWKLFAKQWLKCIVCLVIAHVACVILALIPIIGQIAAFFLMLSIPLCSFLAMEQIDQRGNFDLDQIFSKLKSKLYKFSHSVYSKFNKNFNLKRISKILL